MTLKATSSVPRRAAISAALAVSVLWPAAIAEAQQDTAMTLRELAVSRGIVVGAAVTFPGGGPGGANAEDRPEYERVLKREFNGVVAENAMKFQNLSRTERGVYNFGPGDELIAFAEANNMKVRGHTLVWHSQAPTWFNELTGDAASRDTTLKIMKRHIDTVMGRWRGKIFEWDVVNEVIAQNGGPSPNYRSTSNNASYVSQWFNRVGGPDYIDSAFVYAHRADSTALLYLNDFGGEFMNAKSDNVYDLVKGLVERKIPIHGVGLQCHFNVSGGALDTAAIRQNIRRIAALGLRVSLTEIDIQHGNSGTPTTAQLETQKEKYKALMTVCVTEPSCKSFFTWGVNDNQSWRRPQASTAPLLFTGTTAITPKPAYFGVVEALQAAPAVAVHGVAPAPRATAAAMRRVSHGGVIGAEDARGTLRDLRGRSLPASVRRAMQP
ncbi:MAG TPA: endo-1,4-beta-xylanase [Fibrobacteria bacterium]|jgi:endo-1,4-beta-xylanase|nr:endo-1,4-beta-xylanase [Fibrobacteria bacterium]